MADATSLRIQWGKRVLFAQTYPTSLSKKFANFRNEIDRDFHRGMRRRVVSGLVFGALSSSDCRS
jgi:hypothetical protein